MSKSKSKLEALALADDLCDNYTTHTIAQLASTLFQRTLELKPKSKWSDAEDKTISTFFYLSSKEELCEALSCDIESLYRRARQLGVVNPAFDTLCASDLSQAISMYETGYSQAEVLGAFGVYDISTPIPSLSLEANREIDLLVREADPRQLELDL